MNSVEIRATGNDVTIAAIANSVALSVFDVYTTTYYLSLAMMLQKDKEVESDDVTIKRGDRRNAIKGV